MVGIFEDAYEVALQRPVSLPSFQHVGIKEAKFHFFVLSGLTWVDWATIAGFALTIVGFGITLLQLHRTLTTVQAMNYDRGEINRTTATGRLTESFPSLQALCNNARRAAEENDRRKLRQSLDSWAGTCSQVIKQLDKLKSMRAAHRGETTDDEQVAEAAQQLRSARVIVREALWKIDNEPEIGELESDVRYALRAMSECDDQMQEVLEGAIYLRKVS
jgi:hypothetical protein